MSDYFLGEIRLFPMRYAPKGWMPCEGQVLAISQNQPLFALLGTQYGGNGSSNFQLPDLRGRVPLGAGQVPAGMQAGIDSVTLTTTNMPSHTHLAYASNSPADVVQPRPNSTLAVSAGAGSNIYKNTSPSSVLALNSLTTAGGSQPHENCQPSIALHFCIAIQGVFPSRQ